MAKRKRSRSRKVTGPVPDAVPDAVPEVITKVVQTEVPAIGGMPSMTSEAALLLIDETIVEAGTFFDELENKARSFVSVEIGPPQIFGAELKQAGRDAAVEAMLPAMEVGGILTDTGQTKAVAVVEGLRTLIPLPPGGKPPVDRPRPVVDTTPVEKDAMEKMLECAEFESEHGGKTSDDYSTILFFEAQKWWHNNLVLYGRLAALQTVFGNNACAVSVLLFRGELTQDLLDRMTQPDPATVAEAVGMAVHNPDAWCECCEDGPGECDEDEKDDCPEIPCEVQAIVDAIEGIGETEEEEKEPCKLDLWLNCKNKNMKILIEGEESPGDDWVLIKTLEDGVQIAAEMMKKACEDDDDEDDEIGSLEVEGLSIGEAGNCKVPLAAFFNIGLFDKIEQGLSDTIGVAGAVTVGKMISGLVTGGSPQSVPVLIMSIILYGGVWLTKNSAQRLCKGRGDDLTAKIGTRALYGFFNNIIPGAFDEALVALDQQIKIQCAKRLPSASEAISAFMADEINEATLQCWVTANGFSWKEYENIVLASRTKLGVAELAAALNRRLINQGEYDSEIRELGYIQDGDAKLLYKLNEFIPGPGDIVRFMQRDVDDKGIVTKFGLDADFGKKFVGLTKQLADDQQIPEPTMRRYWRAHWDIPSPQTLIEMFFRTSHLAAGNPQKVEWTDVVDALKQQDILPFWIDKYRIISQRLLTRVDTRRSFEVGTMTEQEAVTNYERSGYETSDAKKLMEFFKRRKVDLMTRHPASKQYVLGGISTQDLSAALAEFRLPRVEMAKLIGKLQALAEYKSVGACIKALHRRFMLGDLNSMEAKDKLFDLNTNTEIGASLVRQWECERDARGKQAGVALLCKWYEDGRISIREWYQRLRNIGWTDADAMRLMADCHLKVTERQEAERQAQLKRMQAEEKRRAALAEKTEKQLMQQLEKDRKKAEAMRKAREAIQRRNTTSAVALANRITIEVEDAVIAVADLWRLIRREVPASEDQASRLVASIVKLKSVVDLSSFAEDGLAYALDPAPIVEGAPV